MSPKVSLVLIILSAVAAIGCDSRTDTFWPAPRPLGAELPAVRTESPDAPDALPTVPSGPLRLRDALAMALAHSPELTRAALGVRQAEAERLQAALPPNPELEAEFENFGGTGEFRGTRALETTLALSQLVELGGKRARRTALAAHAGRLAGWEYEAKRLEVLTDVTGRFIAALALAERLKLARDNQALTKATLDAVAKRIAAGKASGVEKAKATVEVAAATMAVRRIERQLAAARQRLAAVWGATSADFAELAGTLTALAPPGDRDALAAHLAETPAVARWSDELAERQARVALAEAGAIPDVEAGIGYRHARETDQNNHAILVTVGVALPVFDRNQGEIRKARLAVAKARAARRAALAEAMAAFERAYQELAAAYDEAVTLRDEILPAARRSFEAASIAFKQGKNDYLDVLDAQRTLIEARQLYLDALAAYHTATANVEGMIGRPLNAAGRQRQELDHEK